MCYSAKIRHDYNKFLRAYGAVMDIAEFVRVYWDRGQGTRLKIPKAMDAAFVEPKTDEEEQVAALIAQFDREQASLLEQEVFKQRKRLADAVRALQVKTTKAATENKRIATAKVDWALSKLADLRRTSVTDEDARIFPGWYAPVIVMESGRRVVKPMRYQCRLPGKPPSYDRQFPGCYNARRDNLEGFWKGAFGISHGVVVLNAFFENVSRHRVEGRELTAGEKEENVILEFRPRPMQDMLVACLWSRWTDPSGREPELLSFAAITDDPPPEIAAAGHDRCVIPIKPEHIDAWLDPGASKDLKRMYAILDDRERPFFEHRLAA